MAPARQRGRHGSGTHSNRRRKLEALAYGIHAPVMRHINQPRRSIAGKKYGENINKKSMPMPRSPRWNVRQMSRKLRVQEMLPEVSPPVLHADIPHRSP